MRRTWYGGLGGQHGRHIYAYCNVRTNQVLYSLERVLRNSHLKQLADVGANNNPPKLRKDIWRPLWMVSLPNSRDGKRLGLQVFRQLREYRVLHETNWEIPEEMKRPYTEKEIERMRYKLDNRGGSKKETVYDIIKRKKWKMRVRMVMDQKANSIADLAAILLRQEDKGVAISGKRELALDQQKKEDQDTIISLAERNATEANELKAKIPAMEAVVAEAGQEAQNKDKKSKERRSAFQKALHTRRDVEKIQLQIRRMEWSAAQVADAKARAAFEQQEQQEQQEQRRRRAAESPQTAKPGTAEEGAHAENSSLTEQTPVKEIDYRQYLPDFPAELDPIAAAKAGLPIGKHSALQPENRTQKMLVKLFRQHIFTIQDITVKWANTLDAEFAERWPDGVKHDRIGFVRHIAPKPDDEPVDDVRQLRGMVDTSPKETPEEMAAKVARGKVVKRIAERLVAEVTRKNNRSLAQRKKSRLQQQAAEETAGRQNNEPGASKQADEPPVQAEAPKL
ncbi:uncharacterized protein MYCFIDRAFT_88290 [Pseudocercospora fijiensis CIRAD86]|uniref:Large ribosomal subunit protein mL67 n=1 Tax=Pseudocercospora fijiensis (strain CIRAD86) TaxID=383855 RepID=M2Z8P6_PSEFD|nr:uncharacterized protein MYCFIDRAFT_88290 [Pseudocercospora fijiensis CIRAD86]EME86155.1 hypothetical protein MYCFIDRAFT_88290 [Pseudocercospora fijiensis CIRAD86]